MDVRPLQYADPSMDGPCMVEEEEEEYLYLEFFILAKNIPAGYYVMKY